MMYGLMLAPSRYRDTKETRKNGWSGGLMPAWCLSLLSGCLWLCIRVCVCVCVTASPTTTSLCSSDMEMSATATKMLISLSSNVVVEWQIVYFAFTYTQICSLLHIYRNTWNDDDDKTTTTTKGSKPGAWNWVFFICILFLEYRPIPTKRLWQWDMEIFTSKTHPICYP